MDLKLEEKNKKKKKYYYIIQTCRNRVKRIVGKGYG